MRSGRITNLDKEDVMPKENYAWYYLGNGIETFGINGKPSKYEMKLPGKDEILARVDAVALCASDIKMIRMGNDYPLFKNRDFHKDPAILGHELSLTIEEVGENLKDRWKKGMRVGVQPDVYMSSVRYCMGVNVDGGMQHYILLPKPVFYSDQGETIFEVDKNLSYASVAQLEPNACAEASYRAWGRNEFDKEGSILIYIGPEGDQEYMLDKELEHKKVVIFSKGNKTKKYPENAVDITSLNDTWKEAENGFEDILIVGNIENEEFEDILEHMSDTALICWLAEQETDQMIKADIAKIHYGKNNWIGTTSKCLSDAFLEEKQRYELKDRGTLLVMGGAGAMGRIHTLRAIMKENPPSKIVVTARRRKRLEALLDDFGEVAKKHQVKLNIVAMEDPDWRKELRSYCKEEGFDDIVVSAPGTEPVENAVPFLKKDGMLILFSGTKYGSYAKLPVGYVASYGARINASSGSTVEDEKKVLRKIEAGQYHPDQNVMAIAGFKALKQAVEAVSQGKYPGKVIIYPQLDDLPLLDIHQIGDYDKAFEGAQINGWNREYEEKLYQKLKKGE